MYEWPDEDRAFLDGMARTADICEHEDRCGQCEHARIMADVARELLAKPIRGSRAVHVWAARAERRWKDSKYFRLWQDEQNAGRDPRAAFKMRGWEP